MKITLLYQVSHIRLKKTMKYKELGPAKSPCYIKRVCYIRPYNEVPLHHTLFSNHKMVWFGIHTSAFPYEKFSTGMFAWIALHEFRFMFLLSRISLFPLFVNDICANICSLSIVNNLKINNPQTVHHSIFGDLMYVICTFGVRVIWAAKSMEWIYIVGHTSRRHWQSCM